MSEGGDKPSKDVKGKGIAVGQSSLISRDRLPPRRPVRPSSFPLTLGPPSLPSSQSSAAAPPPPPPAAAPPAPISLALTLAPPGGSAAAGHASPQESSSEGNTSAAPRPHGAGLVPQLFPASSGSSWPSPSPSPSAGDPMLQEHEIYPMQIDARQASSGSQWPSPSPSLGNRLEDVPPPEISSMQVDARSASSGSTWPTPTPSVGGDEFPEADPWLQDADFVAPPGGIDPMQIDGAPGSESPWPTPPPSVGGDEFPAAPGPVNFPPPFNEIQPHQMRVTYSEGTAWSEEEDDASPAASDSLNPPPPINIPIPGQAAAISGSSEPNPVSGNDSSTSVNQG